MARQEDSDLNCASQLRKLVWAYLSNSFSFNSQGLHLREVVVISHHISDNGFLIRVVHTDVCNPEKTLFRLLLMMLPPTQQEQPGTAVQLHWTAQHTFLSLHLSVLSLLYYYEDNEDEATLLIDLPYDTNIHKMPSTGCVWLPALPHTPNPCHQTGFVVLEFSSRPRHQNLLKQLSLDLCLLVTRI